MTLNKPIVSTQAPFIPDSETLLPADELDALAEVTEVDIDSAIESWRSSPPNSEFADLLEAESDAQF